MKIELRDIGNDIWELDQRYVKLGFTSVGCLAAICTFSTDENREIDKEFVNAYTRTINAIIRDVVAGELTGYDPVTLMPMRMFPCDPEHLDSVTYDHTTMIRIDESRVWAEKNGLDFLFDESQAEGVDKASDGARVGRREHQTETILAVCAALEFDPLKIPTGGKAKVRAACLTRPKLFTPAGFDEAWKAASKNGLIRMEDHEKFIAGRGGDQ
jgi:hypothetical protein